MNWSDVSDIEVESLIDAGFCYLGISDACMCPWCECVVSGWHKEDHPLIRHDHKSAGLYMNFIYPPIPPTDNTKISHGFF